MFFIRTTGVRIVMIIVRKLDVTNNRSKKSSATKTESKKNRVGSGEPCSL